MPLSRHSLRAALRRPARHAASDRGNATVLSLFGLVVCCMVAGVAIDPSNAYRQKEQLSMAADMAALAGAVELSRRAPESDVRTAVLAAIEQNVPAASVGRTVADETTDIRLVRFDPFNRTILSAGAPNAVAVTLQRNAATENPVRTMLLKLVGIPEIDMSVQSVAYRGAPGKCSSSDGLYAKGIITLSSQNYIGARYCVHSQTQVWLPQQNTFELTSGVSMPNLAACKGKCTNASNPGIEQALFQMNLNLPTVQSHISNVVTQMTATTPNDLKTAFFANKPLGTNLAPLAAAGVNTTQLRQGSVVTLTRQRWQDLTAIPTGLVYNVTCNANGNGPNTQISLGGGASGDVLRSVALITNCAINFAASSKVDNALVITTRTTSSSVLNAEEGAQVGDPLKNCDLSKKVYIMASSGVSVNANFTASNVAFVVAGDINVAASSSSNTIEHKGTSMHAEGQIKVASSHRFNPCSEDTSGLLPGINTIKLVVPRNM